MDPLRASSAFPPAIRARLSTEDTASDSTSSDSDESSGDTSGVAGYESALDDAASLRRPFMPKARITGDDEDDLEDDIDDEDYGDGFISGKDESLFSNGSGKEDDFISRNEAASIGEVQDDALENEGGLEFSDVKLEMEVEEGLDSIAAIYEQIEGVSFGNVQHSNQLGAGGYGDFGNGFVSGKDESLLSNGSGKEDDFISRNEAASMGEVQDDVLEDEGGLEFNDVKLKVEVEEGLDSIATVYEQIEAVGFENVQQSNQLGAGGYGDFGDGFISGKDESLFFNGSGEEDDIISGNEAPVTKTMGEVQDDALENEGGLEFSDVKLELEVEKFLNSIADFHDQIEDVSSENVEQGNDLSGEGCEGFGDEIVSGKEERVVLSNESWEEDDIQGGLDFNDGELEMNGGAVVYLEIEETQNFISDLHDQFEALSSGNVEQSNHLSEGGCEDFGDKFVSEKEEIVFSNGSNEEDDNERLLFPSLEELQDDALENEGGLGFNDVKLEMNDSDLVELEVEEDLDSIAAVHDQIEAVSSRVVGQSNDSALELKDLVVESGNVGTEMNNLSGDIEATQKSAIVDVKIDAEEAEFSQVEDSSEFQGFGTNNAVDSVRDQILDLMAPTYTEAFEPRTPEECADDIKAGKDNISSLDSEEANHTVERYYPTVEISAGFLDNFEEEEHESRSIVTQLSITDNYIDYEYSDSESKFDSFCVAHDEGSREEDELVISEWPARDASLESSEIMNHILKEMEEGSSSSHSCLESSLNHSLGLDARIISGSNEEVETEVDCSSKELFDTFVLAALLRTPSDASKGVSQSFSIKASSTNNEEKTLHSKVDQLRLKYQHLVRRLEHLAGDPSPDHILSKELDKSEDDFVFSCNILVLGKTGVGKSAAINSIFGEERASTDPFQPATASVREISGVVDGVYISLIDTPGLLTSLNDRGVNRKILLSVKKHIRRSPPDAVLYVDRLDAYTRAFDDVPMLRMVTSMLGSSIWNNAIITLTHAASTFSNDPDGPRLCYEEVVARRSHDIQRSIQRAAGDISLVNPVALVENHSSCSRNMDGKIMLPNGLKWRPWLLLLCYSYKILTEVDTILESENSSAQKLFPFHGRSILSSLLKSEVHFKPSSNQGEGDSMTNEVPEEDDEYEVQKLVNEQKNVYLLQKLKNLDREKGGSDENETTAEGFEQVINPSDVPIPLCDTLSPLSFHNEYKPYPCRFLDEKSQALTRLDMCIHYRDCDSDYDGVMIEESFDIGCSFPISLAVQITKDENEFIIYPCSSIAAKHGENGSTLSNFSFQQVRKQLAYNPRGETKFMDSKKSNTAAGILLTFLGDIWVNGFKLEDQIFHGKKLPLVASIGIVRAESDVSYGANLEFRLMEKCSSRNRLSTCCLSALKWRDFAVGANLQSAGQNLRVSARVGLTDPNTGRISIKTSTTKQVHVVLLGLFTIVLSICRSIWSSETD